MPCTLDGKHATSSNVNPALSDPRPDVGKTTKDNSSPQQGSSHVLSGTFNRDARPRATMTGTNVQDVATRGSEMSLSSEKAGCSLLIMPVNGTSYFVNVIYSENTLIFLVLYLEDSMLGYEEFMRRQGQAIVLLYIITQKPINRLLIRNSNVAAISALTCMMKSKPLLVPFNHHCSPWSLSQGSPDASVQCIISPTLTFLPPSYLQSTTLSILICTHAPGAPSQQYVTPSIIYHQAHKQLFAMWQKLITPFPSLTLNGQGLWSNSETMTCSQSTHAIILASHQLEEFTASLETPQ